MSILHPFLLLLLQVHTLGKRSRDGEDEEEIYLLAPPARRQNFPHNNV